MSRILGIDPGSRVTGFGVIETRGAGARYLASGCIRTGAGDLPQRLRAIYEGIRAVIIEHRPEEMAIENVFMQRNAEAALKLGQARGAAICAVVMHALPVYEYTPARIKQAVVGRGNADKAQVQHMVRALLGLPAAPQADAADALACALCHCHVRRTLRHIDGAVALRGEGQA